MPYNILHMTNTIKKAFDTIEADIYKKVSELDMTAYVTKEPLDFSDRTNGTKITPKKGEKWADLFDCAWFNFKGQVPENAKGEKVVLLIDVNGEGCVYDCDGVAVRGITNVKSEFDYRLGTPGKRFVEVAEKSNGSEKIDIWVDCGCNDLFGKYQDSGIIRDADIAICYEPVRKLYYDYRFLYELMNVLDDADAQKSCIRFALFEAANAYLTGSIDAAEQCRVILKPELDKKGGDASLKVTSIGHAHIDLAWLWPIRETKRKGVRTFATAIKNMEKYPEYMYGATQPQLYQWVKECQPVLYQKVKDRVKEGRWEVQGAMWVEPDTNITGAESLVRQIMYGKKFFKEEFDKDIDCLWLPDVFGYTGALPQILKKSGIDYFLTIKLSWSQHNEFPHHTFKWQGIDGSDVIVHMPPDGVYNSSGNPERIKIMESNFKDKGVSDEILLLYGIGDGGGGPGEEHLETLMRERNMSGLLPVTEGNTTEFFKRISKNADKFKNWSGELYLEKHQGTYTTQAKNKKYNRMTENLLRETELMSVMAMLKCGSKYPTEQLEEIWKETLLYQFHDILPGSSIKRVYDETSVAYPIMHQKLNDIIKEKQVEVFGTSENAVAINSLSWERSGWVKYNDNWYKVCVPAFASAALEKAEPCVNTDNKTNLLENDLLKVVFDTDGSIISVYDKQNSREVLKGKANVYDLYADCEDAWDFDETYRYRKLASFSLVSAQKLYDGPKTIIRQKYAYKNSTIDVDVSLTEGDGKLDFKACANWNEKFEMLRTSFPVSIHTNEVTCNIQYGNIKRGTTLNNSFDCAQGEICAHKFVDLSQRDYGVALLNDCKYGHYVKNGVMDINLLRSTEYPGVDADMGIHEFSYALYPHKGDFVEGDVVREGYNYNMPLTVVNSDTQIKSLITVDAENVVVEAIKKAEGENAVIVRLYEANGMNATVNVTAGFDYSEAYSADLMENNIAKLDGTIINLKPYEIYTIKYVL